MSDPTREQRLGEAFVTLADTLVAGYDLVELMHYLVDVAVELLDAAAAGLVLADGLARLDVLASTSERAQLMEILQIRTGRGPCLECYQTGRPVSIPDIAAEAHRWPQFAPLAAEQGFTSVHAVPMRLRNTTIGALNLFRAQPGELAEADRRAAQALAHVATIGILQQRAARESNDLNEKLETALNSRVLIEQAKGIVAQQGSMDMDTAFAVLRRSAIVQEIPLTVLAQQLVNRERSAGDIITAVHAEGRLPG
ncbi:MAG: GAF and ANTAR domain-containing protein [Nakamurella sp.]